MEGVRQDFVSCLWTGDARFESFWQKMRSILHTLEHELFRSFRNLDRKISA